MITEYNKEDVIQYSLTKVLKEWENIDGVSLTIKKEAQRPSNIE